MNGKQNKRMPNVIRTSKQNRQFFHLHQHFYRIINEITFLMRFDESRQKFDEYFTK